MTSRWNECEDCGVELWALRKCEDEHACAERVAEQLGDPSWGWDDPDASEAEANDEADREARFAWSADE